MEINADNLKRLGFVEDIENEGSFWFPTILDESGYSEEPLICCCIAYGELGVYVHQVFELRSVPHAKTIEHIQQLINLFIEPVKVSVEPVTQTDYVELCQTLLKKVGEATYYEIGESFRFTVPIDITEQEYRDKSYANILRILAELEAK